MALLDLDVILLQETHVSNKVQADEISKRWSGDCFWSFGTGKKAGVAMFVSPRFQGKISRFLFDSDGRVFSALIDLGTCKFNLVNVYAPNTVTGRRVFFQNLHQYFLCPCRIIAGDFNCVDNKLDRLRVLNVSLPDKSNFRRLLSDCSLIDVWRKQHPRGTSYTWANADYSQASRLDRFLVSSSLERCIDCPKVFPCTFSDHDFVALNFSPDNCPRARSGVWKFNSSLLNDATFKRELSELITDQKQSMANFQTIGVWWDNLKVIIRNFCQKYCFRKRKSTNCFRTSLTNRLIRAKNDFAQGNESRSTEIRDLECSLSSLALREAEGAKIRSRAKWFEEGEKPTRYFFRRENQRAAKNSFDTLLNSQGEETSSQTDMESILVDFYKNLFSKDNLDLHVQQSLIDDLEFTLSDSERVSCEGDITKDELFMALGGLQTGKSPGSDGLPTEFYKAFWDDLGDVLVRVLNERFHTGILTDSQREGLLRLLFKKDDRRLVKNWRPISLLNTDYKLASKVITERLKRVMQSIVHRDQTCGVVGRSIFSNLQLIRDMLDMIDKTNETGILVTLDQEKAFDRVDHDFLMRVLHKFGFGPSFRGWVSLFYKNVFSRIICNGSLSAPVFLGRGVRQGCPLSPLLYVLVSEVLSNQIRKCRDIEGFRLPGAGGLQFKVSQYADDATLFVKTERSLCRLLQIVELYERGSGAKLNTSKSEAMWLGRWRCNGASPFGLNWVTKLRILGVHFSNGLVSVESENWRAKLDKLELVLNLWKQRDLSFLGRALIVNILGASRFYHVAKIISPPNWVCERFDRLVWSFIWKGKMENVSRKRCCAPFELGGLNVVDFRTKCLSLRLSCFSDLRDNFGESKWHYLARYFMGTRLTRLDKRFVFRSNLFPVSATPSNFYRKSLESLQRLFEQHGKLPDDLSSRNLYCLFFKLPDAAPLCTGVWRAIVGRPINWWAAVWRKSRFKLIENKKNDLLWLLLHNAVRTRCNLKAWGYIDSDRCAVCSRIESNQHCFVDCFRACEVWNFFAPFLSRLQRSPFIPSFKSILFPLANFPDSRLSVYHYFLASILFFIWQARNLATFRNRTLSSRNIVNLIIKDIRTRVLGEPISRVKEIWSVNNVICSVNSDSIVFHLD